VSLKGGKEKGEGADTLPQRQIKKLVNTEKKKGLSLLQPVGNCNTLANSRGLLNRKKKKGKRGGESWTLRPGARKREEGGFPIGFEWEKNDFPIRGRKREGGDELGFASNAGKEGKKERGNTNEKKASYGPVNGEGKGRRYQPGRDPFPGGRKKKEKKGGKLGDKWGEKKKV